ncbi:MAG: hypothetical protein MUF54_25900 [Polyangiaceae bacterium]|nr:hypothetical protein [Polyangiaceae bacterium]
MRAKKESDGVVYSMQLPETSAVVQLDRVVYCPSDDFYRIHLHTFTARFKLRFQQAQGLAYEYSSAGGFPVPQPLKSVFGLREVDVKHYSCPGEAYLIRIPLSERHLSPAGTTLTKSCLVGVLTHADVLRGLAERGGDLIAVSTLPGGCCPEN